MKLRSSVLVSKNFPVGETWVDHLKISTWIPPGILRIFRGTSHVYLADFLLKFQSGVGFETIHKATLANIFDGAFNSACQDLQKKCSWISLEVSPFGKL